jgi:hypothetical protein
VVLAALGLTAVEQYVTILLSDGRFELPKHLFLFHLMTQLALLGLLAWGGSVALAKRGGPPPEGGESPSDAPLEPVTAA